MALSAMEIVLVGYGSGTPMNELSSDQITKFLSVTRPSNRPASVASLYALHRSTNKDDGIS